MKELDVDRIRRRPAMYLGSVDESGLHKLALEILNNSMKEAMTGHATAIEIILKDDGSVAITDNGRGVPIDIHPAFPGLSALEVIFTHISKAPPYIDLKRPDIAQDNISVSACVVNALCDWLWVEVVRPNHQLYRMSFARGNPVTKLEKKGEIKDRRGTTVCFHPDPKSLPMQHLNLPRCI